MTLVEQVFKYADAIQNGRTPQDILNHTQTEFGELMTEFIISEGKSYKQAGEDGMVGEAIDAIVCLIDFIRVVAPELSEEELCRIAEPKLEKWVAKYS